jgi:hypothetical protein
VGRRACWALAAIGLGVMLWPRVCRMGSTCRWEDLQNLVQRIDPILYQSHTSSQLRNAWDRKVLVELLDARSLARPSAARKMVAKIHWRRETAWIACVWRHSCSELTISSE